MTIIDLCPNNDCTGEDILFMYEKGTTVDEQILEEREKINSVVRSPFFKEMRKNNGKLTPLIIKESTTGKFQRNILLSKKAGVQGKSEFETLRTEADVIESSYSHKAQIEHDTIMILRNAGFKNNIPRVHGYKIYDKKDYIFMDYIDGVTLEKFRPISENQLSSIIIQVLYTLYKINKKIPSFRHNDLHLENIMIVKDDIKNIVVSDHSGNRFQFNNGGVKIILIDFEDSHVNGVKNPRVKSGFYKEMGIVPNSNSIYDTHQFLTCIYLYLHNSSSQILKPMSNISSNKKIEIDNEITRILRYIEKKIEPQFLDYGNTINEFIYDGFLTLKGQRKIKNTLDDYISDIKLILPIGPALRHGLAYGVVIHVVCIFIIVVCIYSHRRFVR